MKVVARLCLGIAIGVLVSIFSTGILLASEAKSEVKEAKAYQAPKMLLSSGAINLRETLENMARSGEVTGDPLYLITAAQLSNTLSKAGSLFEYKTEKAPLGDKKNLDLTPQGLLCKAAQMGEKMGSEKAVSMAIETAEQLGGKDLAKKVMRSAKEVTKASGGVAGPVKEGRFWPGIKELRIPAGEKRTLSAVFEGSEEVPSVVMISTENQGSDIDAWVYDSGGKLVAKDTDGTNKCLLIWENAVDEKYNIVIKAYHRDAYVKAISDPRLTKLVLLAAAAAAVRNASD
jgi:hypothetical protein